MSSEKDLLMPSVETSSLLVSTGSVGSVSKVEQEHNGLGSIKPELEYLGVASIAGLASPQHSDDAAVDRFARAMKEKLRYSREVKGRGGWDDPEQCSGGLLSSLLIEHVEKGDPVDVANLAMMLHQRGEKILPRVQHESPVCRLQLPNGVVPSCDREAAEGWHQAYMSLRAAQPCVRDRRREAGKTQSGLIEDESPSDASVLSRGRVLLSQDVQGVSQVVSVLDIQAGLKAPVQDCGMVQDGIPDGPASLVLLKGETVSHGADYHGADQQPTELESPSDAQSINSISQIKGDRE